MPLPVAVVSVIDAAGLSNAAPWSCVTPILRPLDKLLIASWLKRDTLANIRETGEFAVSIPQVELADAVTACARPYPSEVDEFGVSGIRLKSLIQIEERGQT